MSAAKVQSAIQGLWKACEQDRVPDNQDTVAVFLFDRCKDWNKLLGLWQGVVMYMVGLPEEGDHEASMDQIRARVLREEAALKARVQAAAEKGRVVQFLVEIYEEFIAKTGSSSGYWEWFNKSQRATLEERSIPPAIEPGAIVRIHGLTGAKELNGAIGRVAAPPADAPPSDRLPLKLRSPEAAVDTRPGGVLVRPANLQPLPRGASTAVITYGFCFWEAFAFDFYAPGVRRAAQGGDLPPGWRPCRVAQMLGVPLALYQLSGSWPGNMGGGPGVYLLINPVTGFAPPEVVQRGVGPVLVARTDGGDLSVKELAQVHDYHCHLMDLWPDFESDAQRQAALTPRAYRAFTQSRAQETEEPMEV